MASSDVLWSVREIPASQGMRYDQRNNLAAIFDNLLSKGRRSYTAVLGPALRQASHRYFGAKTAKGAPRVRPSDVLSGHMRSTMERCAGQPLVVVAQDTTSFAYPGQRQRKRKVPPVQRGQRAPGIWCHAAMAMTSEGLPLGVLHFDTWMRDPKSKQTRHDRHQHPTQEKESQKWITGAEGVEAALPETTPVLVVSDREADLYDYLAVPRRPNMHLLTRASRPRYVTCSPGASSDESELLSAVAAKAAVVGALTVEVPMRLGRPSRLATLDVAMQTVYIRPPRDRKSSDAAPMRFTLVYALERPGACAEKSRIRWTLLTDREVPDGAGALEVLRLYSLRWQIEVLFKTMKSWLGAERLQTEDPHETMNLLAAYAIVAWRAMHLTHMARQRPDVPALRVLTPDEHKALTAHTGRSIETVADAVLAICILGGYTPYKNGPPPGPKPLMDGIERLEAIAYGWRLARDLPVIQYASDTR